MMTELGVSKTSQATQATTEDCWQSVFFQQKYWEIVFETCFSIVNSTNFVNFLENSHPVFYIEKLKTHVGNVF
jgi:hypothetical protein